MAEEEASVEESKVETESAEEVNTEVVQTEESQKKGASQRIRELANEKNEYKEKYESLAQQMEKLTSSAQPTIGQTEVADEPIIKPGEEIDGAELDKRLRTREASTVQKAVAAAQLVSKQNEVISRINSESQEALKKYPELDPDSDKFNPDLSESVTEAVLAHAKADPYNASPKKLVEKMMRPYKQAVAKEVGQETENIAKQVSETALRPTTIRKVEKPAAEKSIRELEAELGIVQA